jgi:uncharacterized damage-inducible protein DinB
MDDRAAPYSHVDTDHPMTPSASVPATVLFADLDAELARTRRILERYPQGNDDWRPHEKSMPIGRLAVHLATLPSFAKTMLESDELDFATRPYSPPKFRTADDLVAIFDATVAEMRPMLTAADGASLAAVWTLRAGSQVILSGRKGALIRETMISHIVHHRAQLGVYYRLLGVPVPGLYGPSADEPM